MVREIPGKRSHGARILRDRGTPPFEPGWGGGIGVRPACTKFFFEILGKKKPGGEPGCKVAKGNEGRPYFFLTVFLACRNALAVGAPAAPGLRIFSFDPFAMRFRFAWMLLYRPIIEVGTLV